MRSFSGEVRADSLLSAVPLSSVNQNTWKKSNGRDSNFLGLSALHIKASAKLLRFRLLLALTLQNLIAVPFRQVRFCLLLVMLRLYSLPICQSQVLFLIFVEILTFVFIFLVAWIFFFIFYCSFSFLFLVAGFFLFSFVNRFFDYKRLIINDLYLHKFILVWCLWLACLPRDSVSFWLLGVDYCDCLYSVILVFIFLYFFFYFLYFLQMLICVVYISLCLGNA